MRATPWLVIGLMLVLAGSASAQEEDEAGTLTLPGSGREVPLHVVEGDIFILGDEDWCENLIALTEEPGADDRIPPADAARTRRCERFLQRLAENDVVLLPRSLAAQLVALPDELLIPQATPRPEPSPDASPLTQDDVTAAGSGESSSQPFVLAGGDYEVSVEVDADCEFFAAFLTDVASGISVLDIESSAALPDVAPGEYAWDVLAPGCTWSITLGPA